jgi:hypothetical protein
MKGLLRHLTKLQSSLLSDLSSAGFKPDAETEREQPYYHKLISSQSMVLSQYRAKYIAEFLTSQICLQS